MIIILIVALIGSVLLFLAVVSVLDAYDEGVQRQQLERRVRQAKQEVEAIGRETRAAIQAEAQRRVRDR